MTPVIETIVIKSVELRNGITLNYIEQGDRSGIPVVFLHGYTDSCSSFGRLLPHLPARVRALAVTQRGHGDSSRPESGYRPSDFAADLTEFLDAQEIESAVIVGHCMGSFVAQRFALDHPERMRGLVLAGSFTTMKDNPVVAELRDAVLELTDPVAPDFARDFQQSTLARTVPEGFFETIVAESLKVPARVWKAALADLLRDDFSQELSNIKAPTLVVWGDRDSVVPRDEQDKLAAHIRDSQLVVYTGTGHSPHWEEPERFAADLMNFVDALETTRRGESSYA